MDRKLSDAERVVWLVDRAGSLNAGAVARITGPIDEQMLRVALNWLQKRHSMLRTRVDSAGGRAPVSGDAEAVPPIQLRVENRHGNDQWQMEAQHELDQPLPCSRGPLISVVLLKSAEVNDIIITLHHVMNDTASVLYLTRDLLGLMIQVIKGNRTPSLQIYPERRALDDLPMGSAALMNGLMKTTALMVTQVSNAVQGRSEKPAKRITVKHILPKPSSPKRGDALHQTGCARMLHYVLSPEETTLLNGKCKEENTTVHGAVCAAVLQSAGQHICATAGVHGIAIPVTCLSAPRLSRALPVGSGEEIGLFVPMMTAAHYIGKRARFWDIARHTETTVQDAIEHDHPLAAVPLPREIAQRLSEPYSGAILVTSVGRLGIPNAYGAIVPNETRASASVTRTSMADCFGVVINQLPTRLMLSFFYPEQGLSEDQVSLLGATVIKNLRTAICAD